RSVALARWAEGASVVRDRDVGIGEFRIDDFGIFDRRLTTIDGLGDFGVVFLGLARILTRCLRIAGGARAHQANDRQSADHRPPTPLANRDGDGNFRASYSTSASPRGDESNLSTDRAAVDPAFAGEGRTVFHAEPAFLSGLDFDLRSSLQA